MRVVDKDRLARAINPDGPQRPELLVAIHEQVCWDDKGHEPGAPARRCDQTDDLLRSLSSPIAAAVLAALEEEEPAR